jgi:hypothetical protein
MCKSWADRIVGTRLRRELREDAAEKETSHEIY